MTGTIAFFHAHPDDEALLTAGTMARANAEGQRVVLITATSGEAGLADPGMVSTLGERRREELRRSGRILGASRIELLGYADSGLDGKSPAPGQTAFCSIPAEEVAVDVAQILAEEQPHTLVIYDEHGGYGHPDHIHVHKSGLLAAQLASVPRVVAATAPQEVFKWGARIADALLPLPDEFDLEQFENAFTPSPDISTRVNVRKYIDFKRAAMAAHASQATGGDIRTLGVLLKLPRPLFSKGLGTEYYRRLI